MISRIFGDVIGGGASGDIQELQGLMSRRPVDHKACTMIGRISRQLIFGETIHRNPNLKLEE